jgi:hypothetical protein
MPHRRSASARRGQFFEELECEPAIVSLVTSRQGSVLWACLPAGGSSESVGSLRGRWLIDTWSVPS